MKFHHEIGRWGTDPASDPTWTWRKWHQRLPAVTLDLCSGPWNGEHIFLHLSLIGLKKRSDWLGRFRALREERKEYTGWQQFALQSGILSLSHCLYLTRDTVTDFWDDAFLQPSCLELQATLTQQAYLAAVLANYSSSEILSLPRREEETLKTKKDRDWGDKTTIIRHRVPKGLLTFLSLYLGGEFSEYKIGFLPFLFSPRPSKYC